MRDPKNIADIVQAGADMLGFIFFEKSKRYVEELVELPPSPLKGELASGLSESGLLADDFSYFNSNQRKKENDIKSPQKTKRNESSSRKFSELGGSLQKVGVFVNAKEQYVNTKISDYQLNYVQLHGDESPKYCTTIKAENPKLKVIKVFSVGEHFDFKETEKYEEVVDLFLFDTKGKERGGNGFKFNWEILQEYRGETPFLLSGGISLTDVRAVKNFQHPLLWGVDVNSGFESEPGLKKSNEVEQFITALKSKE